MLLLVVQDIIALIGCYMTNQLNELNRLYQIMIHRDPETGCLWMLLRICQDCSLYN